MNKTVNINLAGIFFHIDEDAFAKLQHYLDAIKRSLNNSQGKEEIIADIEARIAELFSDKIKNERQVIGNKEVEEVISIMGQPEDYLVDEEIFEDEPSHSTSYQSNPYTFGKQLFRDTDHSYIAGVSSGLGHYLGIKAIWVRLLWIFLTIVSSGAFILIYIALWIFVPEAKTTADKLSMRGEEVNISNIERKIREGFEDVAGKVRDVDYSRFGEKARNTATSAATGLSSGILTILNIFVKLIGIFILLIAGSVLIVLFFALFAVGTSGFFNVPWNDYVEMMAIGAPVWLISLLTFFLLGIPFFFLFLLGLKILMKKVRSMGTTAKLVLLAIWLLSLVGISIIGVQQATQRAFDGEVVKTEKLQIYPGDTLLVEMRSNSNYSNHTYRNGGIRLDYDEQDNQVMYFEDVNLKFHTSKDSVGKIEIVRYADGSNYKEARDRAGKIHYNISKDGNKLFLNNYLTANTGDHFRNQKVLVNIFLPVGSVVKADYNVKNYTYNNIEDNFLRYGMEDQYITVTPDGVSCETCPIEEDDSSWDNEPTDSWDEESEANWDEEDNTSRPNNGMVRDSIAQDSTTNQF